MQTTPATSIEYEVKNGSIIITKFIGDEHEIVIPSEIDGLPVTEIGERAFASRKDLTSVTIPESVTKIEDNVFTDCTHLLSIQCDSRNQHYKSIDGILFSKDEKMLVAIPSNFSGEYVIPESVLAITGHAFYGCSKLTRVTIPSSVVLIGGGAFWNCTELKSVNIPESVLWIGGWAFRNCLKLTSINIPERIIKIGEVAFFGCTGLTSVTLSKSLKTIELFVFSGCRGLTSVTIPEGATEIQMGAFSGCTGLTQVTIPPSVTTIGELVFKDCTYLISIVIPASVTAIKENAFDGCPNLTIHAPAGSKAEEYANKNGIPFEMLE